MPKPRHHAGGDAAGPSQRQLRVAEEVRHALSAVFARADFRDPDLAGLHVTVTEVRASPDLKHMTAFVSGLGKDLTPEQLKALKRAAPFLRGQVAKAVRLRAAPDLHFQVDTSLGYAMRIDEALRRPEVARDLGPRDDDAAAPAEDSP
ncbi:30S ribosome-binding factor RbfA [Craurococcus roseus]|uniref:Ribosome-binding factor A n=1 Tax=Craurococcus roseus TaxID=77585 RepID=A0ABP3R2M1_9PROT